MRKTLYVCCACGKRSHDIEGRYSIDDGWDESCMLNAIEAYEDSLVIRNGRVRKIEKGGVKGKMTTGGLKDETGRWL